MPVRIRATLAVVLAVVLGCNLAAPPALAHGPITRTAEGDPAPARLFAADSATGEVVVIDLPAGNVVSRLATPPSLLSLGLGGDDRWLFAMRGRDTRRDVVTVIDTGLRPAGGFVFPAVVRSWEARAPGGVRDGRIASVGGNDAIFQEEKGELTVYGSRDYASLDAVPVRTFKLAAPDHYHYLEAGPNLYVGHLAKGMVQILDRASGQEVARVPGCPVLHGMASDDASGRLFFACMNGVLVVGTRGDEANREVARVPYPAKQRASVFYHGRDGVLWGAAEGANPAILRLDPRQQPYAFQAVPVNSAIQRGVTDDGNYLLVYSRNGTLDIRDGGTGELLHELRVSRKFDREFHEHVDKAVLPDILTRGTTAWVSIPTEGRIVEVDIPKGRILRKLRIGGEPTRLVVVEAPVAGQPAASR